MTYRWSSIQIGGHKVKRPILFIRPKGMKPGEDSDATLEFDSLDDMQRMVSTLQGYLNARRPVRVVHYFDPRTDKTLCGKRINRRFHILSSELNHVTCPTCQARWHRTIAKRTPHTMFRDRERLARKRKAKRR